MPKHQNLSMLRRQSVMENLESGDGAPPSARSSANLLDLHRVIAEEGLDVARERAVTKEERASVQAARAILAIPKTEEDRIFGSIIVTSLPHKSIDRSATPWHWLHESRNTLVELNSGLDADGTPVGIPFGSKARLILLYLQSEAVRHHSPVIDLGPSMYSWLRAMSNQPVGGMTYRMIAEQSRRIAACRLQFNWKASDAPQQEGAFVDRRASNASRSSLLSQTGEEPGSRVPKDGSSNDWTFPERVVLDDVFYRSMEVGSLIPVRRSAIRQISNNSVAIDLYILLSQRLPSLKEVDFVPWASFGARFGSNYQRFRQMKPRYVDALRLALAVYPEARVELTAEGLMFYPSPSPLPDHFDPQERR